MRRNQDADAPDIHGNTPLHTAARAVLPEECARLLDLGADLRRRNEAGRTPLEELVHSHAGSASGGEPPPARVAEAALILLAGGAAADLPGKDGQSPLTRAARAGDFELFKLLFRRRGENGGAGPPPPPEARDSAGTLLRWCLAGDYSDLGPGTLRICELLLEHDGECARSADPEGNTPLHTLAKRRVLCAGAGPGELECLAELLDLLAARGADFQARNRAGDTPLDILRVEELRCDEEMQGGAGYGYGPRGRLSVDQKDLAELRSARRIFEARTAPAPEPGPGGPAEAPAPGA